MVRVQIDGVFELGRTDDGPTIEVIRKRNPLLGQVVLFINLEYFIKLINEHLLVVELELCFEVRLSPEVYLQESVSCIEWTAVVFRIVDVPDQICDVAVNGCLDLSEEAQLTWCLIGCRIFLQTRIKADDSVNIEVMNAIRNIMCDKHRHVEFKLLVVVVQIGIFSS